ncbi:MAG: hypothetical protein PHV18_15115 [Lachnospiraceae bacterium]|nr:hypothetical protein [Lachnospiraceae bacterium]
MAESRNMTFSQFEKLPEKHKYELKEKMRLLRRRTLDDSRELEEKFRIISVDGIPICHRPTDAKICRDYDQTYTTWLWLFRLSERMTDSLY